MSNIVFSSLKAAVKGTVLLVTTVAAGQVLWFFLRVLIVRNIPQEELGIYSLALTVMSIAAIFANLGLFEGATRHISVARGEGDTETVRGTIKGALTIIPVSGLAASLIIYFISDALSIRVFDIPGLALPLKVIAAGALVSALVDILVAILRGYGIMEVKAVNAVANPMAYGVLLAGVFLLKLPFIYVIAAFITANLLSLAGIFLYTWKKLELKEALSGRTRALRKGLLVFSLPLMGVALTGLVMTWTDTLMIGYFMDAEEVGIYSVGISLSKLLLFAVNILGFVFMPIAGELYSRGQMAELRRTYQVLTKWAFSATFPVFLVLFFFPEMTLTFLFGKQYEAAALVLRILSLNFIFSLFAGLSSLLLTVLAKTRLLMVITVIGAIFNVGLNYTLIPLYGIAGAATATLLSNITGMVSCTVILYRFNGIHPFTAMYLRPVAASAVIAVIIYAVAKSIPLYFWMLPIYLLLFIWGYVLSILFTKSIEQEDLSILDAVTGKVGLKMTHMKRFLKKFVRA